MTFRRAIVRFLAVLGTIGGYFILCMCGSFFFPMLFPGEDIGQSGMKAGRSGIIISTSIVIALIMLYFIVKLVKKPSKDWNYVNERNRK
jgi:uncharacterized BrkB/YihY/UPF0761 family membrane protein